MSFKLKFAVMALALTLGAPTVVAAAPPVTPTLTYIAQNQDVPPPPDLAKDRLYMTNTERAVLRGTIAQVRAFFDANPVTDFVTPTDAIPAINGITYLAGDWPNVGALRRVDLAGGHSVHEQVLANEPDRFAYQIWNITAPAGVAINHITGEFRYVQTGDTVKVTWDYNIKPNFFVARPAIQDFLVNDFGPFMRAGLTGTANAYAAR